VKPVLKLVVIATAGALLARKGMDPKGMRSEGQDT